MRKFIRLAFLCCILIGKSAFAEMPVEIVSTAPDTVGQRLVFGLKEGIRSSTSLGLSYDKSKPRLQVNIVTLDQNPSNPGYSTVYAVVVVWNNPNQGFPLYLNQYVGYCGSNRVRECADSILSVVSETSDSLLKLLLTPSKR